MENAVEALKQAFAVFVFALALTVSFTMFSKAKATADAITTTQSKQEYLESAELKDKLYINSKDVESGNENTLGVASLTMYGDRVVQPDDVISTIYRYNLEKYGVTIIRENGTVITRFDSNTESVIRQWYNIKAGKEADGTTIQADDVKNKFTSKIKQNIEKGSVKHYITSDIKLDTTRLEKLYKLEVEGNTKITVGAPWYGNDKEIIKRINAEISGSKYELNGQIYNGSSENKNLKDMLDGASQIIEVITEIDNSEYVKDNDNTTNLLKQYELPTIEVVYIIKER